MKSGLNKVRFNPFLLFLLGIFLLASLSCKKEDTQITPKDPSPPPASQYGSLYLEFSHVVDAQLLEFGKKYLNPSGDTFTVSKFMYYISNLVLVKEDNSLFTQDESYFLVDASKTSSTKISINSVPYGKYKSIRFVLGVDSIRNVSGAQTGALDPANGMFWNWNTGYIMLKLEGAAPSSTVFGNTIEYHMGGYKGVNKTQRSFEIGFNSLTAQVAQDKNPKIRLQTNINEMFSNPNTVRFATLPIVTSSGANAKLIADNYQDMITFTGLE